jgi:predicted phosphodiesterase
MRGNRASALGLAWIVLALLLVATAVWAAEQPAFRFAVLADTHVPLPDASGQPPKCLETIREVNLLDYDLAFVVGDLIPGNVAQPAEVERMWDNLDAVWRQFAMPARKVAGNHDIWNTQSEAIFARRYGRPYYSFDQGGCHFVVLDCEEVGKNADAIRGAQLEWLKQDLEASRGAAHLFVFLHEPLWTYNDATSNWNREVHPLLAQHHADAVFAGHYHSYEEYEPRDGVRYFLIGTSGGDMEPIPMEGQFRHHMSVSVRGAEVRYAVVETGSVKPTDIVSERSLASLEALRGDLRMGVRLRAMHEPAQIRLVLNNASSTALEGSLVWRSPDNWSIEPAVAPVSLQPGASAHLTFTATVTGDSLFPLPESVFTAWFGRDTFWTARQMLALQNDWFVRQWHVIGPFALYPEGEQAGEAPAGFEKAYLPEPRVDLSARYPGAAGEVAWKPVAAKQDGHVDLRANVQPSDAMVAYAAATVTAKRAADALLTLGSNDGAKVWVNGEQVYAKHIGRGARPHDERIPVKLREGPNQVLLKVENWGSAWGFYVAIVDFDGTLTQGL